MDILEFFPIVLFTLGSILLIVLIILGVKLINTIDKTNRLLDDSYRKMQTLNSFFNVIDHITDTLSSVSDSVVNTVSSVIGKLFYRGKKKNKKEEDDLDE